jgi:hypothetical protein
MNDAPSYFRYWGKADPDNRRELSRVRDLSTYRNYNI